MQTCSACNQNIPAAQIRVDLPSFRDQLHSEYGPTFIQPEEIAAILQKAQRELDGCDQEIRRLVSQQNHLREYVLQIKSLLSPIRKLPDELLHRIFDECCDMNRFQAVYACISLTDILRAQPALSLSRVCSKWRRIALDLPGIWSRISLDWKREDDDSDDDDDSDSDEEEDHYPERALEQFIKRSKQMPLTVVVNTHDTERYSSEHLGKPLSLLVAEYRRWRSFTFVSRKWLVEELLDRGVPSPHGFPQLVDLQIWDAAEFDLEFFNGKIPRLRSLQLPVDGHSASWMSPGSHFGQLSDDSENASDTYTSIASLEIDEIMFRDIDDSSVLSKAKKLVPYPKSSSLDTLVVHHCGTCSLHVARPRSVFRYFTLPSLNTLRLRPGASQTKPVESYWANSELLGSFLQRSSCPLVVLSLEGLALSDVTLINILLFLPTLCKLTVDDSLVVPEKSPITIRLVQAFHASRKGIFRQQPKPLLPRLRCLAMNYGGYSFDDEVVVDMVQSRWIQGRHADSEADCLREFTLKFRERRKITGAYAPLEEMERDGMRMVVKWKEDTE